MPEHPLSSQWYVSHGENVHGPFTGHELKKKIERGAMGRNVLVQSINASQWTKAHNDPILGTLFSNKIAPNEAHQQVATLVSADKGASPEGISSADVYQLSLIVCFFIGFVPVFGACFWSFVKGDTGMVALFFQFWLSSLIGGIVTYVAIPFIMPFVLWMRLIGR